MKNSAVKRSAFKLGPVAAGCAVLVMATSGAYAQDLGSVTVTGIRSAIETAIAVKKGSDNIVEAVSAEDLGKLPDSSIAESISRLPGVTSQRNRTTGKASQVSVRGMSSDFNGGLLNGREQASIADSRGVEFDQYPAELLNSVVVYKTPDAALVGQGLASTIDLRMIRPLDVKERKFAANWRKERTGVSSGVVDGEGQGEKKSLSYVDQFMDRKLGIALGVVKFKESGAATQVPNTWGGWSVDYCGAARCADGVSGAKVPAGMGWDLTQSSQDREAKTAVLQFKPNADFESTLDYMTSKGSTVELKPGIVANVGAVYPKDLGNFSYNPTGTLTNATIVNGVVTSGTITNRKIAVTNNSAGSADELTSWGWNNKLKLADWTAVLDVSSSKVTREGNRYETIAGVPGNGNKTALPLGNISWTGFDGRNFDQIKYTSSLDYSNPVNTRLTDVMGWSGDTDRDTGVVKFAAENVPQTGYLANNIMQDKVDALRLSGKTGLNWGPVAGVEVGVNSTKRSKVRDAVEGRTVIAGSNDPYASMAMPNSKVIFLGNTGIPSLSFDPTGTLGSIYQVAGKADAAIIAKAWSVKEDVVTSFIKGDLDGTFLGYTYVGNVGVQWQRTDQTGAGSIVAQDDCLANGCATVTKNSQGKSYDDFNPSLNVSFNLASDQVLRLGLARVLSRPGIGALQGGFTFRQDNFYPGSPLRGSGGNPNLEPFRANALDISYEKYFGKTGYVSVAGFYKNLQTYILNGTRSFDFAPYMTATTKRSGNGSTVGVLQTPINGSGGNISGFELAASLPFSMISKSLSGFGAQVNYSSTNSAVQLPATGFYGDKDLKDNPKPGNIPLPGLSKEVMNVKFYYEANGWQVAVSQRKRSDFLGLTQSPVDDQRGLTFVRGETIADAQIGYEFDWGYLKGLSILAQASNLNNAQFEEYDSLTGATTGAKTYGKTYTLGLNYKF